MRLTQRQWDCLWSLANGGSRLLNEFRYETKYTLRRRGLIDSDGRGFYITSLGRGVLRVRLAAGRRTA
jgi:hypothetical protein